jgi:lipopolysaccharide/colanic/teichoic acid biosynthesis glycosyltransferase
VLCRNDFELSPSASACKTEDEQKRDRVVLDFSDSNDLSPDKYSRSWYKPIKRAVDIVVVLLVVPAVLVVVIATALAILVSMGRPVLFAQERVGLNGRIFKMLKFRTMRPGDHKEKAATATLENDPRITPLGRLLRRSHIDELPQLWNILRGEMTLIGPRPEQVHLVTLYRHSIPNFDKRHVVKPGLSGWAQVKYGYAADENDTREKLLYDLFYVSNFGPALDLQIALHTVKISLDPRLVR